jgi:c-di-GMP-binding flagellar brake protein YcgR
VEVGSIIELEIELPEVKIPITCLAKVMRVEPTEEIGLWDIAVCFLDISSADRARLNRYVIEKNTYSS